MKKLLKETKRDSRALQVYEYRLQGFTLKDISEIMGISAATVHRDLVRVLDKLSKHNITEMEKLRQIELERLDAAQVAIWERVQRGDLDAIDVFLGISDRRCRLLGLYLDTRVQKMVEENIDDFISAVKGVMPPEVFQRVLAIANEFRS
ncbi:LuxR C-terminal-related transcriptional regulator [Thermosynechococcus sp. FA-CM-4201]